MYLYCDGFSVFLMCTSVCIAKWVWGRSPAGDFWTSSNLRSFSGAFSDKKSPFIMHLYGDPFVGVLLMCASACTARGVWGHSSLPAHACCHQDIERNYTVACSIWCIKKIEIRCILEQSAAGGAKSSHPLPYYQAVIPEYHDFHCFIWRTSLRDILTNYWMSRLTFRVSASSFAANMAVKQYAIL